jgi:hypothetical protein
MFHYEMNNMLHKFLHHLKIYEERRCVHIEFMRNASPEQWQWWLSNWESAHYWLMNQTPSFGSWTMNLESKTFHVNILHVDNIPVKVKLYSFDDSEPPLPFKKWSDTVKSKQIKYLVEFSI